MRSKLLLVLLLTAGSCFAQWDQVPTPATIYDMAIGNDSLYIASYSRGVMATGDGLNWHAIGSGKYNGNSGSQGVFVNDTCILEASLYGIFYSKFNGTWNVVGNASNQPQGKFVKVVSNGKEIFALNSGDELYVYHPGPNSWIKQGFVTTELISSNGKMALAGGKANDAEGYGLYKFEQNYNSEEKIFNDIITSVFQNGDTILTIYYQMSNIAVSMDGGAHWMNNAMPVEGSRGSLQEPLEMKNGMIYTGIINPGGFYLSSDFGKNWTLANAGLPKAQVAQLKIFKEYLYAVVGGSIFRRKLNEISGIIYNGSGMLEAPKIKDATYQWSLDGVNLKDSTNRSMIGQLNGQYGLTISLSGTNDIHYFYQVDDLSITANRATQNASLHLFNYNRSTEEIQFIGEQKWSQIQLMNMTGMVVINETLLHSHVNVSRLPSGIYFVKMIEGGKAYHARFYKD